MALPVLRRKIVPGGKIRQLPAARKDAPVSRVCFGRFDLIRMFLEIQIQARLLMVHCTRMNGRCCMLLLKIRHLPRPV